MPRHAGEPTLPFAELSNNAAPLLSRPQAPCPTWRDRSLPQPDGGLEATRVCSAPHRTLPQDTGGNSTSRCRRVGQFCRATIDSV